MSEATSNSCLYEGIVRHRRRDLDRAFQHPLTLFYIDLDEAPRILAGRLMRPTFGPLRLRRSDYHGPADVPLGEAVHDTVQQQTGRRPAGPVRMLTSLRTFGHCFNPVTFYYCFAGDGQTLETVLAEVTNTPWGERQAYAIRGGDGTVEKAMHVSPFMGMDYRYLCKAPAPGDRLTVSIENLHGSESAFDASLTMRRRPLDERSMRAFLLRYPLAGIRVLALIYGRAVGLKLAGARIHPHPERSRS